LLQSAPNLNDDKTVSSVREIGILGYCVGRGRMKPDPERLRPLQRLPTRRNARPLKKGRWVYLHVMPDVQQISTSKLNC